MLERKEHKKIKFPDFLLLKGLKYQIIVNRYLSKNILICFQLIYFFNDKKLGSNTLVKLIKL